MTRLQQRLRLRTLPRHIECFDVSLFQGSSPVVSQVVFVHGVPEKSLYRQYNIKTVTGTDDYAMLAEAIGRRLKRGHEEGKLPDLILVDGGKGQLFAAMKELSRLDLGPETAAQVSFAAIAKSRDLGEERRGYAGRGKRRNKMQEVQNASSCRTSRTRLSFSRTPPSGSWWNASEMRPTVLPFKRTDAKGTKKPCNRLWIRYRASVQKPGKKFSYVLAASKKLKKRTWMNCSKSIGVGPELAATITHFIAIRP